RPAMRGMPGIRGIQNDLWRRLPQLPGLFTWERRGAVARSARDAHAPPDTRPARAHDAPGHAARDALKSARHARPRDGDQGQAIIRCPIRTVRRQLTVQSTVVGYH
ncbi:MAG: hypothetical protein ACRDNS_30795, partial [Trebonia sp.]